MAENKKKQGGEFFRSIHFSIFYQKKVEIASFFSGRIVMNLDAVEGCVPA